MPITIIKLATIEIRDVHGVFGDSMFPLDASLGGRSGKLSLLLLEAVLVPEASLGSLETELAECVASAAGSA